MGFCSHCGAPLEANEHFCVKCGSDVSAQVAQAASAPIAAPQPIAAPPAVPAAAAPTYVAGPYPPPGAVPAPIPPQAPANSGSPWTKIIIVGALVAAGYYYYNNRTPASTPATPGTPAAPATPGAPAAAPPALNAQLAKQQSFAAHWQAVNGFIQISNGAWTNSSIVPIQSATLECDQYATNGTDLAQFRMTLNGPVPAGTVSNFSPFQMGEVALNMNSVTCTIVDVVQTAN
jgi:hypothetical protein